MKIPKVNTFEIQIITPNDYFIQLLHAMILKVDTFRIQYLQQIIIHQPLHVIIKKVGTFEMR